MLTNRRSTLMIPGAGNMTGRPASHNPGATPTLSSLRPENEPQCASPSILTTTTPELSGYRITRVLGTAYGSTTYAIKDTKSLLKAAITGSEIRNLTHMAYNARDRAVERMTRDCVSRGANAVVGMSFSEGEILGFVQVSVYGTAVFVEREKLPESLLSPR
ncbi:hypothetical protein GGS23DRAFT_353686 [Durotheca rogersii]|uniref:uncharacterized protein n=1 Tax=Durotheca rogersii TaxID=419775 RepID=UPI00221FD69B|nr:uncharacterized protein GGS23DRAFT_353686 [Durotheca rogersii]KAI5865761.1 hypothetical protein GGS23DRAFT_353686 [Durotheca rogersii]